MADIEYEKKWGKGPHLAADAIVFCMDRLLLIRRRDYTWALPGGFVNPGESTLDAAKRELREETHLDLDKCDSTMIGTTIADDPERDPRSHIVSVVTSFFVLDKKLPKIEPGDDAKDAVWVDKDQLRNILENGGLYADHQALIHSCSVHLRNLS